MISCKKQVKKAVWKVLKEIENEIPYMSFSVDRKLLKAKLNYLTKKWELDYESN